MLFALLVGLVASLRVAQVHPSHRHYARLAGVWGIRPVGRGAATLTYGYEPARPHARRRRAARLLRRGGPREPRAGCAAAAPEPARAVQAAAHARGARWGEAARALLAR